MINMNISAALSRAAVIVALLVVVLSTNASAQHKDRILPLSWIEGDWVYNSETGTITESWVKDSDSSYSGEGKFMDKAGKVKSSEKIKLNQRDGYLWYVPVISNQNGGNPVYFKEVSNTPNELVFENLEHDYPQRITYRKVSDTEMIAIVEGKVDNQEYKQEYRYIRK